MKILILFLTLISSNYLLASPPNLEGLVCLSDDSVNDFRVYSIVFYNENKEIVSLDDISGITNPKNVSAGIKVLNMGLPKIDDFIVTTFEMGEIVSTDMNASSEYYFISEDNNISFTCEKETLVGPYPSFGGSN